MKYINPIIVLHLIPLMKSYSYFIVDGQPDVLRNGLNRAYFRVSARLKCQF